MVTSSAVVGSSAIRIAGRHASAIAIITRWRMPPDIWCGYSSTRCSGAAIPTRQGWLERFALGLVGVLGLALVRGMWPTGEVAAEPPSEWPHLLNLIVFLPIVGAVMVLFLPRQAPFDLWNREHRRGVKLYVRRVFIMDDAEQLMPPYLRFVRGIIDSNDLPLNVSREILQQSRDVQAIRTASVKRVLGLLEELAEHQPGKFTTFWTEFGRVLKEGVIEDTANRDRLAKLLRFASTRHDGAEQTVSLADYVAWMKEGQEAIYYLTADGYPAARNSPHLEIFRKLGVEVLLMYDPIDEWVVTELTEFEGKPLHSVARGDLDLSAIGGEAKAPETAPAAEDRALIERIQSALKDRASAVRRSARLTDSPACLVASEHAPTKNLERILKAAGQDVPPVKPILEINADHPIVKRLAQESDDARFAEWSQILFDQATLAEGGQIEDPAAFVKRLNDLLLTLAGEGPSRIWTP